MPKELSEAPARDEAWYRNEIARTVPGALKLNVVHHPDHKVVKLWLERDGFDPLGAVCAYDPEEPRGVELARLGAHALMLMHVTPPPAAPAPELAPAAS